MKSFTIIALAASLLPQPALSLYPHPIYAPKFSSSSLSTIGALDKKENQPQSHNFSVPIDHFHNETKYAPHSNDSYPLRYWLDTKHYHPGGPVIVLHSGEFSGVARIPYLTHGIAQILARELNGIAVLMEHRYYGTSFPVPDLSPENLRFLSTEQALADTDYFARNVVFPGMEGHNLTAPNTPWVIYGGSYAGAFAALTRKIYPDTYMGGISSSGVPQAILEYWEYLEAPREYSPGNCGHVTSRVLDIVDKVLFSDDEEKKTELKKMFGFGNFSDEDFGETVATPVVGLQGTNWNSEEEDHEFGSFCGAVTAKTSLYSSTRHLEDKVAEYVKFGGWEELKDEVVPSMLNHIGYMRAWTKKLCGKQTKAECFTRSKWLDDTSIQSGWYRSWTYQTCTQWGFFMTGAATPKDRLPMWSRKITLEHLMKPCREVFNITTMPDLDSINKYGGLAFSHHRLAFIDGAQDPWRAAGPHALSAPKRKSTDSEPFILVDPGVHHWDEFGVREGDDMVGVGEYPPRNIREVQEEQVRFVKVWLREWEEERKGKDRGDDGELEMPGEL